MEEINNFAPVLIPTLNRHVHFKYCVESLSRCTYADKTDLFIALDYPLNESHWEGYKVINEYVDTIKGFNTVHIIRREKNFGVERNLYETMDDIFENHETLILSEDDNEFAPNFLEYINKGLRKFKDAEDVFAICGYNYPIDINNNYGNHYLAREYSAWGVGLWKGKTKNTLSKWDFSYVESVLKNPLKMLRINRQINSFLRIMKTKRILGDVVITADLNLFNKYCVFPIDSLVKNYGHDGTGQNSVKITGYNKFLNQKIDNNSMFEFSTEIDNSKQLKRELKKYFYISVNMRIKNALKYFIYITTGKIIGI